MLDELDHHLEALIGVVDQDVLLADRRETVAAMLANAFGKAGIERRELEVGPILLDENRETGHAEEAARFGRGCTRRVEAILDHSDEAFRHSWLEFQPDDFAAATALDRCRK